MDSRRPLLEREPKLESEPKPKRSFWQKLKNCCWVCLEGVVVLLRCVGFVLDIFCAFNGDSSNHRGGHYGRRRRCHGWY